MRKPKRTDRRRHKPAKARRAPAQIPAKWSADVTRNSNALDLEPNVFKQSSPNAIARSLKRSAESSSRRKSEPYRSAMSMLSFYINRAGSRLSDARRGVLERAKVALRKTFGRR